MQNKTTLGVLCSCGAHVIWGLSFMFSALALSTTTPLVLLGWRFILAFGCINLLRLSPKFRVDFRGKKVWKLVLLGLCEPVIYFLGEQYGLVYTNSSFSGVMIALIPVATTLAAIPILHEKPTASQLLFSLLSISGVIVLALQNSSSGAIRPIGVLILMVAVLAAMGYSITSRSISQEFTPFERTYFMMLMGCICFPILAILQNVSHPAALFAPFQEWKFWVSLLYLGTLSSIGAYTMSSYAITHLPLARTVVFANLTTAVSVLAGVIFLHEHFTWISALCCLVIIIGVWGTQKMAAPQPAK